MRRLLTIGYFICVCFYEYYDRRGGEMMRTDDWINGSFDGRGSSAKRGVRR